MAFQSLNPLGQHVGDYTHANRSRCFIEELSLHVLDNAASALISAASESLDVL